MSLEGGWVEVPIEFAGFQGSWRIYWDSKFGKKLIEIHDTAAKIVEALSNMREAGPNDTKISLTAHGTGITGDVASNTITGGTITSFTIDAKGKGGTAHTKISGFDPQDAVTFFDKMKSLNTDYEYAMSLLAGDTVAKVQKGSKGGGFFDTGAGNDKVTGGIGDDIALKWQSGDLIYNGGKGTDTLDFSSLDFTANPPSAAVVNLTTGEGANPYGGTLTLKNVENIRGAFGASNEITGNSKDNLIRGGTLADTLLGMGGNDSIYVKYNATGGARATHADGGTGKDTLTAELTYMEPFIGSGFEQKSINRLDLTNQANNTGTFKGGTFENFEIYKVVQDFNTLFHFTGTDGAEKVYGTGYEDDFDGGGGDDLLAGGFAADELTGGAGADRFWFRYATDSNAAGRDTITDFSHAEHDRIDLSKIFGGKLDFLGGKNFGGHEGEVRVTSENGDTLVEADITGDKIADFVLLLEGGPKVVGADLVL
jgi:Ca2+-binding RTX toxin-like protein